MKDIKMNPSNNADAVVSFSPTYVQSFKSEAEFVAASKEAGHFANEPEQDDLLKSVYQKAAPNRAPVPVKAETKKEG